jgi:hypothetical protein
LPFSGFLASFFLSKLDTTQLTTARRREHLGVTAHNIDCLKLDAMNERVKIRRGRVGRSGVARGNGERNDRKRVEVEDGSARSGRGNEEGRQARVRGLF